MQRSQLTREAILAAFFGVAISATAAAQFSVSGPGGTFPTSATGTNGVYPGQAGVPALPPNFLATQVTVPAGATQLTAVVIHDLYHTWSGDAQFILMDPAGVRYNVCVPPNIYNTSIYGNSCAWGSSAAGDDYTFVDPSAGAPLSFPPNSSTGCNGGSYHTPGTYPQYFGAGAGAWPAATPNNLNVFNTPLQSIPVMPGTWTLECYDWFLAGDNGTFSSWELQGLGGGSPVNYCTAGTTTNGCVALISASAQPSVSAANPCVITVASVEGQKSGLVFYGVNNTGFTPATWGMGTSYLCVKAPTQRTATQTSGGTAGACDGQLSLDWNAYQAANPAALGNPWMAGDAVYAQGWFRDPPASKTTNLSDGVEMTYQP